MKLILCFFVLCFRMAEGWRHLIPAVPTTRVRCDNPLRLCEMVEAACGMVEAACENSRDVVRNSPGLFFLTRRPRKNSPGLFLTTTKTTNNNFFICPCCPELL